MSTNSHKPTQIHSEAEGRIAKNAMAILAARGLVVMKKIRVFKRRYTHLILDNH